jgi:hypothetical protein
VLAAYLNRTLTTQQSVHADVALSRRGTDVPHNSNNQCILDACTNFVLSCSAHPALWCTVSAQRCTAAQALFQASPPTPSQQSRFHQSGTWVLPGAQSVCVCVCVCLYRCALVALRPCRTVYRILDPCLFQLNAVLLCRADKGSEGEVCNRQQGNNNPSSRQSHVRRSLCG